MDSGKQKYINKNIINEIRDKMEQIEDTIGGINHIKWRIENKQPYESLKVLKNVETSIKKNLKIRQQELKQLQDKLIIS